MSMSIRWLLSVLAVGSCCGRPSLSRAAIPDDGAAIGDVIESLEFKDLNARYANHDVQLIAINTGSADTIADMASFRLKYGLEFPVVKDMDGSCATTLGVTRTPEVCILDHERRLVYRGRIDDQYRIGGVRPAATRSDLEEALKEVLAGRAVSVSHTRVDGCLITSRDLPKPKEEITFSRHIAPMMQKNCQTCHRPGTAAPFSLISYDDVAAQGEMIAEVVSERRMPPWYAARRHNHFANDPSLSRQQIETVLQWVDANMPEGDRAELPPPVNFDDPTWRIGEPDLVLKTAIHKIPADGYLPYKYAIFPHVFLQETWIVAAEIRPHNRAVVHHCNMAYASQQGGAGDNTFVTGFVPGGPPLDLRTFNPEADVAFRIPALSVLLLQIHYVTTGREEESVLSVGLRFPRNPIHKQLHHVLCDDRSFKIPPGHYAHRVSDSRIVPKPITLRGLFCHMHFRGKDMTFLAHKPDGTVETLLEIPNFNFDWQRSYVYKPGVKQLPGGTRIEAVVHYDNSSFNPYNPDPKRTVPYGDQRYLLNASSG